MRQLIFVHGRSQQGKDPAGLKRIWIESWERGLRKIGLENPLPETHIRFPHYGNALIDLLRGKSVEEAAEIIIKGPRPAPGKEAIMREMLNEIAVHEGVAEADIRAELAPRVLEKGPLNWGWVQGIASALDRIRPLASRMVAIATADVAEYLSDPVTQKRIDDGVRAALLPGHTDAVIVSHSLGTVVAYNTLLGRTAPFPAVTVPLFVTLGSPLGMNAVKSRLKPHTFPPQVRTWFNAMDEDDFVSLHALDKKHFNTGGKITNHTKVDNWTENQHGIEGYLDDAQVAKRIYDAVK
jgi:hypothetical protein